MLGMLDYLEKSAVYVLDTNIIVDYVDVIPDIDEASVQPNKPTIDLSSSITVVPSTVVRELSNFKKESSERGRAARVALRRLRKLAESKHHSLNDVYSLGGAYTTEGTDQVIVILPIQNDYREGSYFKPSSQDMDGQIILTALKTKELLAKKVKEKEDESASTLGWILEKNGVLPYPEEVKRRKPIDVNEKVVLLTNDNGLAIRARERGILTSRYGYQYPAPYTGRRDLVVPKDLLLEFLATRNVTRAFFEEMMPNEPPLIANEFIIMLPDEDSKGLFDEDDQKRFKNIGMYDALLDQIVPLRHLHNFPLKPMSAGQAIYAEALTNPDISAVICTGPAGSGKTYMSTIYGYAATMNGEYLDIHVVPCADEGEYGALPGDLEEKLDPAVKPFKNALRNFLLDNDPDIIKEKNTAKKHGISIQDDYQNGGRRISLMRRLDEQVKMIWHDYFISTPVKSARGLDFKGELAIYDEFQDQPISYAKTLLTRLGRDGKIVICGDLEQIRAPYLDEENNGLTFASRNLQDLVHVAQVTFLEEEVVRHPLVKLFAKRQKAEKMAERLPEGR